MIVVPQIGRSEKLPEVTARKIFEDVVERGWPVGELLGSEGDLIAHFGVSRAVLREAVRLLEHLQIARMRRGPGGGLFVTAPGVEATTEAIARHVERNRITPAQLFEVRSAIEMTVLDRVLEHPDPTIVAALEEALAAEQSATRSEFVTVGHDLHGVLADLSGNRVLQLLTEVLIRLTRTSSDAAGGGRRPAADRRDHARARGSSSMRSSPATASWPATAPATTSPNWNAGSADWSVGSCIGARHRCTTFTPYASVLASARSRPRSRGLGAR